MLAKLLQWHRRLFWSWSSISRISCCLKTRTQAYLHTNLVFAMSCCSSMPRRLPLHSKSLLRQRCTLSVPWVISKCSNNRSLKLTLKVTLFNVVLLFNDTKKGSNHWACITVIYILSLTPMPQHTYVVQNSTHMQFFNRWIEREAGRDVKFGRWYLSTILHRTSE